MKSFTAGLCVSRPGAYLVARISQMLSGTQKAYGPPDPHDNRHQSANKRNLTIAVVVCGKPAKCHRRTRRSNPFLAARASCGWVASGSGLDCSKRLSHLRQPLWLPERLAERLAVPDG